eukprot:scaffold229614_cov28-Tisochrysis_lutea.AAC.4
MNSPILHKWAVFGCENSPTASHPSASHSSHVAHCRRRAAKRLKQTVRTGNLRLEWLHASHWRQIGAEAEGFKPTQFMDLKAQSAEADV